MMAKKVNENTIVEEEKLAAKEQTMATAETTYSKSQIISSPTLTPTQRILYKAALKDGENYTKVQADQAVDEFKKGWVI